jgi:hypothetical protein
MVHSLPSLPSLLILPLLPLSLLLSLFCLSLFCLSSVSLLSLYCLSSVSLLSLFCLSTVSLLSLYCLSPVSLLSLSCLSSPITPVTFRVTSHFHNRYDKGLLSRMPPFAILRTLIKLYKFQLVLNRTQRGWDIILYTGNIHPHNYFYV